jgi:hypothetical protein
MKMMIMMKGNTIPAHTGTGDCENYLLSIPKLYPVKHCLVLSFVCDFIAEVNYICMKRNIHLVEVDRQ